MYPSVGHLNFYYTGSDDPHLFEHLDFFIVFSGDERGLFYLLDGHYFYLIRTDSWDWYDL